MAKETLELEVKSNIGTVSDDAKDIKKEIQGAKTATDDLTKSTDEAGESAKKAKGGFGVLGKAVKGVGTALKALGIVAIIAAAFNALKEALERNQKVMDAVNVIMTTISTTFNQVIDVLVDTYNAVSQSTAAFDGLGKVLSGITTLVLTPLKASFFGIKLGIQELILAWEKSPLGGGDTEKIARLTKEIQTTRDALTEVKDNAVAAGADIVNNFGDAIGEIGDIGSQIIDGVSKISIKANLEQAKATTAAQNSSKLAEAQLQGLIEKNDKLAEVQRQIRDDETKTFAERIEANQKLGDILNTQEEDMLKLADARVNAAALELAQNKDNIDLQVAYQQTLNDRAGVEAQIAGFRSEQLINENSLNKELLETQKELRASALEGLELELQELQDSYDQKVEMANKAGEDITAITEKYEKDQTKIKENYAKEQKAIDQSVEKAKVDTIAMGFQAAAMFAEEGSAAAKGIAVAQTIFNTQQAIMKAMADVPFPMNIAQSVLAGAMGAKSIATIMSTDPSGGGGGGGGGGGATATAAPPAPQMMSGAFDLTGVQEPEPVKAFVVTDEMTNSQNQLANIRRRATI